MSFAFAPMGWGRSATGSYGRPTRIKRCSHCSAPTVGGEGRVNFALPDLRGRTLLHVGSGHTLGERGGEQAHTLSIAELPTHTHVFQGSTTNAGTAVPTGNILAAANNVYTKPTNLVSLAAGKRHERGREPGASEYAAVPDAELLHCTARHFTLANLMEVSPWLNPMWAKSACSLGISHQPCWMFCEGQLLPISENETLFQLIDTTYGGDGQRTFALPDLRGRIP